MPSCIRRLCAAFCAVLVFCALFLPCSALELIPSVSAQSAILTEAHSGRIIYEKNARIRMPMASTTKIMTALVALETGDPDATVTVDPRAVGVEGSSVYLKVGERMTLRELVFCLMLASANDAAAAIAYHISGSIEGFAELMNKKAAELGLSDTHFENPHGLDSEGHYTTARELAIITAHALENAELAEIVATNAKTVESDLSQHALFNHNKLLRSYEGCVGVKTGYTKRCGRCLVSAAERDGLTLICVTLNAPDDWNDHTRLLDYGFEHYRPLSLCRPYQSFYEMPVVSGESGRLLCVTNTALSYPVTENQRLTRVVECHRFAWKMPKNGTRVGRVVFYLDGKPIAEAELTAFILN